MNAAQFRRAGPDDAAAVRALTLAAYQKWVSVIGREPRPMTADYDLAVVEHQIDLLEQDGRLVALVELSTEPDHLLIVNIAVDPSSQGHGIGRLLLEHAENVAGKLGFAELRLYTNALMKTNIVLYARHGYEEYRREQLAPGWVGVHMRKWLVRPEE